MTGCAAARAASARVATRTPQCRVQPGVKLSPSASAVSCVALSPSAELMVQISSLLVVEVAYTSLLSSGDQPGVKWKNGSAVTCRTDDAPALSEIQICDPRKKRNRVPLG